MIADASPLFGSGIRQNIESQKGFNVVGEVAAFPHVISIAEREKPEVIILGLSGCDSGACEGVHTLTRYGSVLAVIHVDGTREALSHILKVFQAGAVGCIDRMATEEELIYAVKAVATGRHVVSSVVAKALIEELLRFHQITAGVGNTAVCADRAGEPMRSSPVCDLGFSPEADPDRYEKESLLTARETEVLAFLAGGETNRAIANHLSISEKTVKNHVSNILRKLGVVGRTEAAVWAVRRGFPSRIGRQARTQRPTQNESKGR